MHKELGKIRRARFGSGGYQDVQVVFSIEISGKGWGSCKTYEGGWGHISEDDLKKPGASYKWTHESRIKQIGEVAWEVYKLMQEAGVDSLDKLEGIPIEATFDSPCGRLQSIRILKEVL